MEAASDKVKIASDFIFCVTAFNAISVISSMDFELSGNNIMPLHFKSLLQTTKATFQIHLKELF